MAKPAGAKKLIGKRLGRYTLVEHLATGGMAEIFLARDEASGSFRKDLVLKILQPRWAEHPPVVEMFEGEARIAALLSHPNIVDVYDLAFEEGNHFIAMEYVRGKTLIELAKRAIEVSQQLPLDVGVHIVGEVAAALAYMNEAPGADGQPMQVVHRDVSPTNVIIATNGEVKLIDFGIARQGSAVSEQGGVRPGKASYMSPEQAKGEALDGRSDIFSLGTILYEITVGRRLWRGAKEDAIRRIVEEKPAPPSYVVREYPGDLEMVVMRALEKRPEDRYQSASELADDLQRFLQESGAKLRSHHQMARYLRDLYSPAAEAQITEDGLRQARIFAEGDDGDGEALDFDQVPSHGPGAALARALRAAGPVVAEMPIVQGNGADLGRGEPSTESPKPEKLEAPQAASPPSEPGAAKASPSGSVVPAVSPVSDQPGPSGPRQRDTPLVERRSRVPRRHEPNDKVPRSLPTGAVLFVAALVALLAGGVVWLLRGG
jgi:serine/threonine protein kinase